MPEPRSHPTAGDVAEALEALRSSTPLVQSLTNVVSANFVTNVLLAAGASNAHIDNVHEAAGFAAIADGVLINLGTPDDGTAAAFTLAAGAARAAGTPWVLDPVGVGGLPWRTELAAGLLALGPTAIRGNASEIIALAGSSGLSSSGPGSSGPGSSGPGSSGRGVDSTSEADAAVPAALSLLDSAQVVSASGPIDYIVGRGPSGPLGVRVSGGHALLTKVTATGCSLAALVAAYLAVSPNPLIGITAAHVHVAVAAEAAARGASGPGSFAVAYIDALASVTPDSLRTSARIEPLDV
ncbi:hydroxyethylthiazole kinase [Rhodococcoides yunnanense]|jgi:hydroxyethylthiazole kinase|uniref:hydroxyethylthiazole kinase n=1 Tax=Rhodococcoides yunnanense TaxID=278209 RepID=UPI0022B1864C|nr:hydroxyethylthiazole kinase [Rhodococcus yunnanensis]MCZ4274741.1 hydroxyethylthiazole kinase [Rhodococcus yunnanensis]